MRLSRLFAACVLILSASFAFAQDGGSGPQAPLPEILRPQHSADAVELLDSARSSIDEARKHRTTLETRRDRLQGDLEDLEDELERYRDAYASDEGPPPLDRADVATRMASLTELIDADEDGELEEARRREADRLSRRLERIRHRAATLDQRYDRWVESAEERTPPEEWEAQSALWTALELEHQRTVEQLLAIRLESTELLGQSRALAGQLTATRVAMRVLLARENLSMRGESLITVEAVAQGLDDLSKAPDWVVDEIGRAVEYLGDPANTPELGLLAALCAVVFPSLFFLRLRIRRRFRPWDELSDDHQRSLNLLSRLGGVVMTALLLAAIPSLCAVVLTGLSPNASYAWRGMAWVIGIAWVARGLTKHLLPTTGAWTPLQVDARTVTVVRTGMRLLIWGTVVLLPIVVLLHRFQYENRGAVQALWSLYKLFVVVVTLVFLLKKGVILSFVMGEESLVGRATRSIITVVRPVLLLVAPALLALDLLEYNLLATVLVRLIGGLLAGVATTYLLHRCCWSGLSAWFRAILEDDVPEGRSESDLGAALIIGRYVMRVIAIVAGFAVMLAVGGGDLASVHEWLDNDLPFQDQVEGKKVTYWGLVAGSAIIGLFLTSVSKVKLALESFVLPRISGDTAVRYTISTLSGYAVAAFGLYVGLIQVFDLSALGYIFAALSVGIGFGLQEIVSNFISGLILLFERPIKVGDLITVGGTEGWVKKINIRATRIQTFDNVSLLIPNKDFITQAVVNSVYSDTIIRVRVAVGVAYGSDTELVHETLMKLGTDHPDRMPSHPAEVIFMGFGASSLDFELRCWVSDVRERFRVASDLRFQIDNAFRERGIEIPFPQRDLHLRSVDDSAARQLRGESDPKSPDADAPEPPSDEA